LEHDVSLPAFLHEKSGYGVDTFFAGTGISDYRSAAPEVYVAKEAAPTTWNSLFAEYQNLFNLICTVSDE
jgi:hypothetical protein